MEHATTYAEHVERVLKIATGLALSGQSGTVAQMTGLARAFYSDKTLCRINRDSSGPRGRTRLMHAARTGNAARAAFLLQCGASPRAVTKGGQTALHLAAPHSKHSTLCTPGHLALVPMLVQGGADVNAVDEEGYTPLLLAANPQSVVINLEMVRVLVENGADLEKGVTHPGEDDIAPWTPLTTATVLCKWEAAAALMALGAKVDAPVGAGGHNSLSLACQRGDVASVRRLLDLGADIAFKSCGFVAIPLAQLVLINQGQHGAAPGAHLAVFKELLARGISLAAGTGKWGGPSVQEAVDEIGGGSGCPFKAALDAHMQAHPEATAQQAPAGGGAGAGAASE